VKRACLLILVSVAAMYTISRGALGQSKDGQDRRVMIINERTSDMLRLYGSRTTTSEWEENILITPIRTGTKRVINFDDGTGACMFDFRAIFRDNMTVHQWSINVCREEAWRTID
jgi:hypothetical protein